VDSPSPDLARRNLEIKARLPDFAAARLVAHRVATDSLGVQRQKDTYFHCPTGRLKLREIDGQTAQLVWYAREDRPDTKASDYILAPVDDSTALHAALTSAYGARGVVEKRREIFLHHNVRIHLDEVTGLGTFLEFEAVLSSAADTAVSEERLRTLLAAFGIAPSELLSKSYSDMLNL
jgi:predicted adenylyl cyclase CyaB